MLQACLPFSCKRHVCCQRNQRTVESTVSTKSTVFQTFDVVNQVPYYSVAVDGFGLILDAEYGCRKQIIAVYGFVLLRGCGKLEFKRMNIYF